MTVLREILTPPQFDGAACKGRHRLYDRALDGCELARREALTVCSSCAVLDRCRGWHASLAPGKRPLGVVAGRYFARRRGRVEAR
jgi:WhiB family redox-sensing transcriptional regulator